MIVTIKKGQNISVNEKDSNHAVLSEHFELLDKENKGSIREYVALKNLVMSADNMRSKGWSIHNAAINVGELVKQQKEAGPRKEVNEAALYKAGFEIKDLGDDEVRILWLSRHNMNTEAYLALQNDLFPGKRLQIIPCQPRIVDTVEVIRLAKRFGCDVICAVLKLDGINQYDELLQQLPARCQLYRPLLQSTATGAAFSPKSTLKIYQQKEYTFNGWMDMRTKKVYGAPSQA